MKMHLLFTIVLMVSTIQVFYAQIYNVDANIIIESGATLMVEGDIENDNMGTITNLGTIEMKGDFTNSGTFNSNAGSKVIFSGNSDQMIISGGSTFQDIEMKKTAADVILIDNMMINGDLNFLNDDNQVLIGGNDLIFGNSGTVTSPDQNEFIVTGSTGQVIKNSLGNTAFVFPVGYDQTTYNPATLTQNGTADDMGVRVIENLYEEGLTQTTTITNEAVEATWIITENTVGGSDLDLSLGWTSTDELPDFDRTKCGVSFHDGSGWTALVSDVGAATGADPYEKANTGFTQVGAFSVGGKPVFDHVKISPKVFLSGPYNGSDMNDGLRAASYIPTTEPYAALTGFTHKGFGGGESVNGAVFNTTGNNAVVDWVFLEARDKADDTNILATCSALLQRDGDVVGLDNMSPVTFSGLQDDGYFIVIRHRNHLGIMTGTTAALTATTSVVDLTGAGGTYGTNARKDLSGGVFGMWGGNVTGDEYVRYSQKVVFPNVIPSDALQILALLGNDTNGEIQGYNVGDVTMDGYVRYSQKVVFPNVIPSDALQILALLNNDTNGEAVQQLP